MGKLDENIKQKSSFDSANFRSNSQQTRTMYVIGLVDDIHFMKCSEIETVSGWAVKPDNHLEPMVSHKNYIFRIWFKNSTLPLTGVDVMYSDNIEDLH